MSVSTNNANLYAVLAQSFSANATKDAFRIPGNLEQQRVTFAELEAMTARMATTLAAAGAATNERVLVQVDKSIAGVAVYLACLRLGAIYVPINVGYTAAEVEYFLGDAEPILFVCQPGDEQTYRDLATCAVRSLGVNEEGSLATQWQQAQPSSEPVAVRAADDIAAILYTSGTTGRSKGAMLTHSNLVSNAQMLLDYWGWQESDVLLHALPIFHVHGLFVALHCSLLGGTPCLFVPGFAAGEVNALLPQATVLMGVPTFYTRLLALPEFTKAQSANMRLFISGSAPLTEQTFADFQTRTGHKILERYGMSETLMNTSNPLQGERVAGTVGFALPNIEARIVNDAGQPLAATEVGGIEVRGPNVFQGYWRMPEKTAAEFRDDGFFITGDLGTMDDAGRVTIVGREKDLVISGGYNVYPKEVERLLDEMPSVVESAVIGVPHPDFGEAVVAIVVPRSDEVGLEEVKDYLGDQLAKYKQPKAVFNLAELPRNTMGKVQKNALRKVHEGLYA